MKSSNPNSLPDAPKAEIPPDQLNLLHAESQWILPRLGQTGRVLWLGPAPKLPDQAQRPAWLQLTAVAGPQLSGDLRSLAEEFPLQDDVFDHVVLQHPLESGLSLSFPLLDEAIRVLKPECSLWLIASGSFSRSRLRMAAALAPGTGSPQRFSRSQTEAELRRMGCTDLEWMTFSATAVDGQLRPWSHWLPLPPVLLLRARKRRSATTLRLRGAALQGAAQLAGIPAYPATRVGLAA